MTDVTTTEAPPAKRPPGRPPGYPRSGGRQPGTPNRANQVTRDYIVKEGTPIRVLCQIAQGRKMTSAPTPGSETREHAYPTLDQRLRAAEILARKVVPDLKSVEATGGDGGSLVIRILRFGDGDDASE